MSGEARSALHASYEALGAHFATVRGRLMPERFGTVEDECRAVRTVAGVVDRSDLGYLTASGGDAQRFLQGMVTNDVAALAPDQGTYAVHLTTQGHIVADFYLLAMPDHFLLETARNRVEPLRAGLERYIVADDVEVADRSDQFAALSVEGPAAGRLLTATGAATLPGKEFNHTWVQLGAPVLVVRLSETGEEGYRLIFLVEYAQNVWDALTAQQQAVTWKPVGHAALNILRTEAGLPWYGIDMDERTLPPEAGLEQRALSYTKGCYIGQEIIERIRSRGHVNRRLTGLLLSGESLPATGAKLFSNDKSVGTVTTTVHSPTLKRAIGLGYVRREHLEPGTRLRLESGGTAEVAELPFYRQPVSS